jgi:hypothetical protein
MTWRCSSGKRAHFQDSKIISLVVLVLCIFVSAWYSVVAVTIMNGLTEYVEVPIHAYQIAVYSQTSLVLSPSERI